MSRWTADPQPGSMGFPLPGWEVRVLDDAGGDCACGVVGRLALRGPGATMYWRDPERQAEAVTEGWSLTGDLVYRDRAGCYWHVCRNDDVIKSRGYRISPGEVEDALLAHGAVYEPAVIGAPDPVQGQKVKAFVTLKDGHAPSSRLAEEMRQFVRARLPAYQIPAEIEFVQALPKTETGKIRRRDLKELEERRSRETLEPAAAAKDSA
jgi:acetyl-CoA synthetase